MDRRRSRGRCVGRGSPFPRVGIHSPGSDSGLRSLAGAGGRYHNGGPKGRILGVDSFLLAWRQTSTLPFLPAPTYTEYPPHNHQKKKHAYNRRRRHLTFEADFPPNFPSYEKMSSDAAVAFALLAPSAALAMSTLISASASPSVHATPKTLRVPGPSSTMASSASTPTCRSLPVQHDLNTPRARARAARLRANEAAERREDLAALITTPVSQPVSPSLPSFIHSFIRCPPQAQWALLRRSFAGVKTEFADLDGMSWDAPGPVVLPASAPAPAPAPAARSGRPGRRRRAPSVCGSVGVPVLSPDDGTVRPSQGRKRRCVGIGAWVGVGDHDPERAPPVA